MMIPAFTVASRFSVLVGTFAVASIAMADGPPKLKIDLSCTAASENGSGRNKRMCLDAEQAALTTLTEKWPRYSFRDRNQCISMATHGSAQSYVELLICLDTMSDAEALRKPKHDDVGTVQTTQSTNALSSEPPRQSEPTGASELPHPGPARKPVATSAEKTRSHTARVRSSPQRTPPQDNGGILTSVGRFLSRTLTGN